MRGGGMKKQSNPPPDFPKPPPPPAPPKKKPDALEQQCWNVFGAWCYSNAELQSIETNCLFEILKKRDTDRFYKIVDQSVKESARKGI
jgi:hypothetical protein